jgi:hypothetical protein
MTDTNAIQPIGMFFATVMDRTSDPLKAGRLKI